MRCWGWRGLSISAHPQHTYNPTTEGTVTDIPAMQNVELEEALSRLAQAALNEQVKASTKVAVAKASVLSAVSFLIVVVSLLGAAAGIFAMVRYW